jgi:hypothetical protein
MKNTKLNQIGMLLALIVLSACSKQEGQTAAVGNISNQKPTPNTSKSEPTDSEVKSTCYKSLVTITEAFSGQKVEGQPGQTVSEEQAKAVIEVTGIERGTPRASGATEIVAGIPDGTDLFPTRVTINFKGTSYGNGIKLPDTQKKLDFYFYKNDHKEWVLTPENN